MDLTVSEFLKRIGWKNEPGYQFRTNGTPQEDRFSFGFSIAKERLSWTIFLQFYLVAAHEFGPDYALVQIRTENKEAPPEMLIHKFAYDIEIKRLRTNELEFKLQRVDTGGVVLETMATSIAVTKGDEYVHFGVMFGITPLYEIEGTANFMYRIYEEIYCWYDGETRNAGGHYDIQGSEKLSTYEGEDNAQFVDLTTIFYEDIAMTRRRNNFCGVKLLMYGDSQGAYPSHKVQGLAPNKNPQGLCMARGVNQDHCNAYAFQTKPGVVSTHHTVNSEYKERPSDVPVSVCEVVYRERDCMVPVEGYNRELTLDENPHILNLPIKFTAFQGSGKGAMELKVGRVRLEVGDGPKSYYWVKCPPNCKLFDYVSCC